jgi:cytochrome c biogenesis protein CcmG/thiol:disulfide interchange protein DsbE
MWRYAIPLVLLAVIGFFFYRGLSLDPRAIPSALVGKPMPEFVALLNVWGTWCIECRHEHGFLVELARSGVPIYGLNLKDDRPAALSWLSSLGNPYVGSGFDEHGIVAVDWGVTAAPETFLIGRDGKVLFKHISPLTAQVWRRDFLPLIRSECAGDAAACPFLAARGSE